MKTANEYLSREALISKLEASQRELAEAQKSVKEMNHVLAVDQKRWQKTTADLRKQLAELEIVLSDERELVTTLWDKIDNLKSDLADSQAEVELERGLNVGNLEDRRYDRKRLVEMEKKLFASQAEVERLRGMLLIKENGCPLCGEGEVQYLSDEIDVWCSACESNYAGMMLDRI